MKRKVLKKIEGLHKSAEKTPWYGVAIEAAMDKEKGIIYKSTIVFLPKSIWNDVKEGNYYIFED